jgi:hypothetical protein
MSYFEVDPIGFIDALNTEVKEMEETKMAPMLLA